MTRRSPRRSVHRRPVGAADHQHAATAAVLWIVGGGVLAAYLDQQNESDGRSRSGAVRSSAFSPASSARSSGWSSRSMLDAVLAPLQRASSSSELIRNAPRHACPKCAGVLESIAGTRIRRPRRYGFWSCSSVRRDLRRRSAACWAPRSSATTCRRRSAGPISASAAAAAVSLAGLTGPA